MALTIDSIRNFAGNGSVTFDLQNDGLRSGMLQKFRSFFNIGNARQQNADTLVAIHHAIANDPRFAAPDVQAEAARLLSQVRTDRAIGAAQIKGIVQTLDSLTLDTEASVRARVTARLAATMPPWAAGYEKEVSHVVILHVTKGKTADTSYSALDVVGRMQEALARIDLALTYAGDDPDLREILLSTLERTMRNYDSTLASEETVRQRVDTFREDLARLDACAQRSADPAAVKKLGVEYIQMLGKPVHPGVIDALDDFVRNLPAKPLGALTPQSTGSEIIRTIHRFAEHFRTREVQYPDGVTPLNGGDELMPTQKFLFCRAIAELPSAAQKNFLAALESDEGRNACAYIANQSSSGKAVDDFTAVGYITAFLQKNAGRPVSYPGENDRPYIGNFSPLARCAFEPDHAIYGSAAAPLRAAFLRPHRFDRVMRSGAALHERIDAAAKSMISSSFATEMKKFATGVGDLFFDGDIVRGMSITLPDGTRVANDLPAARDQFARLVTGDDNATYATLAPADRTKANAFMALIMQETESAAERGIPIALSRTGSTMAWQVVVDSANGPFPTRAFEISGSPAEGFSIHYQGTFPGAFLMYEDEHGSPQQTENQTIVATYEMEMHISPAALDQVANTDWSQFDGAASEAVLHDADHPDRLSDSYNAIPPEFRLDLEVSAGFAIQADTLPA